MSTSYRILGKPLKRRDVESAASKIGLKVYTSDSVKNIDTFALTDGKTYLWFTEYNGGVSCADRYGNNYDVEDIILRPLADEMVFSYLSEHEDGFFDEEVGFSETIQRDGGNGGEEDEE